MWWKTMKWAGCLHRHFHSRLLFHHILISYYFFIVLFIRMNEVAIFHCFIHIFWVLFPLVWLFLWSSVISLFHSTLAIPVCSFSFHLFALYSLDSLGLFPSFFCQFFPSLDISLFLFLKQSVSQKLWEAET